MRGIFSRRMRSYRLCIRRAGMLDIVMPYKYDGVFYIIEPYAIENVKYVGKYNDSYVLILDLYNTDTEINAYSILLLGKDLSIKKCMLFHETFHAGWVVGCKNTVMFNDKLYYMFGYKKADLYKRIVIGYTNLSDMSHVLREISVEYPYTLYPTCNAVTDGTYIYFIHSGYYYILIFKVDKDLNILKARHVYILVDGRAILINLRSTFYYNGYIFIVLDRKMGNTHNTQIVILDTDLNLISSYIAYVNAPHSADLSHTDSYAIHRDIIYVNSGVSFEIGEYVYHPLLGINRDTFVPEHIVKIYSSSDNFTRPFFTNIDNKMFYAPTGIGYIDGYGGYTQGGISFLDPDEPSVNVRYFKPLIYITNIASDGMKYIMYGKSFVSLAVFTSSKNLDVGDCIVEYGTGIVEKVTIPYGSATDVVVGDESYSITVPSIEILDVTNEFQIIRGCPTFYSFYSFY